MDNGSLRKQVNAFASNTFPEVFHNGADRIIPKLLNKINSKGWGLIVVPITLSVLIMGLLIRPSWLQFFHVSTDTARIIVDQRLTNLATIFSISLVVVGWLITNISVKESISYQLLFKRTYLYPIFYYIISLLGGLMLFSMLRHESYIDMGSIVVTGTYLIIIALALIVFLFVRLINVVDTAFFYEALERQVLQEVNYITKDLIIQRKSEKIYKENCEALGLTDGIRFMTDLSNHTGINITPLADNNEPAEKTSADDIFATRKRYVVHDIKLSKISNRIKPLERKQVSYYRPLQLGSAISENYFPFYFHNDTAIPKKLPGHIKKAFSLRTPKEAVMKSNPYQDYFNEKFLKDIKEGKKENIQKGLAIYTKIFDLQNKINKHC